MGMGTWGIGATVSDGLGAPVLLVRTPVPPGIGPAVRPAYRWLGTAKPVPGGVPVGLRRRGPMATMLRVWWTCRLEGVSETCFWG